MLKITYYGLTIVCCSALLFFTTLGANGVELEKRIKLNAGYNYEPDKKNDYSLRGSGYFDLRLFVSEKFDFIIKDTGLWVNDKTDDTTTSSEFNYINDFYCNFNASEYLVVSAGILNNTDGLSYVWNPMDLFVPKYDFSEERVKKLFGSERDVQNAKGMREGLLSLRIESFFNFGSFKFAYAPYISEWAEKEESKRFYANTYNQADYYLFRFTWNYFSDWTPEFLYFRSQARVPEKDNLDVFGLSLSKALGDFVILQLEATTRKGTEVETLLLKDGEYQFEPRQNQDDYYVKAVAGLNIVTEENLEFILEYYYNQEGYSKNTLAAYYENLTDCHNAYVSDADPLLQAAGGECLYNSLKRLRVGEMSRNYLFIRAAITDFIIQDLNFSVNYLVSLTDKSLFVSPRISYQILNDLSLSLNSNHAYGPDNTEFGNYLNKTQYYVSLSYSL